MVFGGLGIMFYGGQTPLSALDRALSKVDMQSVFFATICVIVILVLAYLTNPSETSFRTYLTEQSFRQHLSRLDDSSVGEHGDSKDSGVHFTISRRSTVSAAAAKGGSQSSAAGPGVRSSPFHFASRAAVSLRTPKHVFYSFGIMTIAAVLPSGASNGHSKGKGLLVHTDGCGFLVSESWFIGAFGKWWRGGPIQSWWVESVANTKDAERCNSGVLDMKALDNLECFDGLPPAPSSHLPLITRDSPSKSRGTERSLQRTTNSSARSITPPPLPKSASLPLHAPRISSSNSNNSSKNDKANGQRQPQAQASSHTYPPTNTNGTALTDLGVAHPPPPSLHPSASAASAIFDNSPVISDLLRQISTSNNSNFELRTQLNDFRQHAAESHSAIQSELDAQRERKRVEDTARAELKAKTKTLEDAKRTAEAGKRDAEKRLRAAESARDSACERMERLGREISALQGRMDEDEKATVRAGEEGVKAEEEVGKELERKTKEVKVAEDVVAALSARAKELEEKIAEEEERLRRAKEQAELRKQDRAFYPLHVVHTQEPTEQVWSPIVAPPPPLDPHTQINTDLSQNIEVFPPPLQLPITHTSESTSTSTRDRGSSLSSESRFSISPRPKQLSLSGISNFRGETSTVSGDGFAATVRPLFQDDLPSLSSGRTQSTSTRFSPFGDNELEVPPFDSGVSMGISPRSTSLIPTSLIKSLESGGPGEEGFSRSFWSESDTVLDTNWRKKHHQSHQSFPVHSGAQTDNAFSASPTSITYPSFDGVDKEDPFEIRPPPVPLRHRITSDGIDIERTYLLGNLRASSDPQPLTRSRTRESVEEEKIAAHRRWFSKNEAKDKDKERERERDKEEKKGLNPEAKVFQFKKTFPTFPSMFSMHKSSAASFDGTAAPALVSHPSSMASTLSVPSIIAPPSSDADSVFSTLSMRAFAPSPEEREVLSRALGSSTNASLERLPTLSDVVIGSMPPSPNHVHAIATTTVSGGGGTQQSPPHVLAEPANRSLLSPGFAWLQSLPRMSMRKPKFSPWDDEPASGGGNGDASADADAYTNANGGAHGRVSANSR